eukprot:1157923-Pelagomonas_calceolata.AAC.5
MSIFAFIGTFGRGKMCAYCTEWAWRCDLGMISFSHYAALSAAHYWREEKIKNSACGQENYKQHPKPESCDEIKEKRKATKALSLRQKKKGRNT